MPRSTVFISPACRMICKRSRQALNLAIRRIADPDIKPGKVVVRGKLIA